mgnify:CR=1 FL=1
MSFSVESWVSTHSCLVRLSLRKLSISVIMKQNTSTLLNDPQKIKTYTEISLIFSSSLIDFDHHHFFGGAKRLRLRDNYQKPIRKDKVTELFTVLPWKERRLNVIFMAPWFMNKLNQPWIIPNFTFLCLRTSSMIMTSTLRKNRLILHFKKSKNINKKCRAKKSKAQLIF